MPNTAVLVAHTAPLWPAWQLRATTGGVGPVTFPATPLRILVELQLGPLGLWVDVSPYVRYDQKIVITRGRRGEHDQAPPSTCALTFKNGDRRFSPRNVTGPYYGMLGRNIRLRVSVNPGSGMSLRFTGRIPDWTPKWVTGQARTVRVEASGPLRQLEQGEHPIVSSWHREILNPDRPGLLEYWPCEDGERSTTLASAVGGNPITPGGTPPNFAAYSGWLASGPLPTFEFDTYLLASPRRYTDTGETIARCFVQIPSGGVANESKLFWIATSGTAGLWVVWVDPGGNLRLKIYDNLGAVVHDTGLVAFDVNGRLATIELRCFQVGADINWEMHVLRIDQATGTVDATFVENTLSSSTVRIVWQMLVAGEGAMPAGFAAGHLLLTNDANFFSVDIASANSALTARYGETTTARFARLCAEEGVACAIAELYAETETMGAQTNDEFMTLLREVEDVNEGVIDETFDGVLRLSSRTARYTQQPALVADYTHPVYGNQVLDVEATDDDRTIRNDVTITRAGGSSRRATLTEGPLSILDPPAGVGPYIDAKTLNLATDAQAANHAGWRVRKGTIDEMRYPSITFALHRNPELIGAWLACDTGSRVQVLHPPDDVGPTTIDQIVEGYTETIDQFEWTIDVDGSPTAGSAVALLPQEDTAVTETTPRLDCDASTLHADYNETDTTLFVDVADTCFWDGSYGNFIITVGGEDMRTTFVGGPFSPQQINVVRSVNGAVLRHSAGESVHVKYPIIPAL